MGRYILRRFLFLVFTLWIIVTVTFLLMHAIPGNPFKREKAIPPAIMANLEAKYGLDAPLHVQYTRWIGNLLHGDMGISMKYTSRTVNEMIRDGFPYSASLGLRALAFSVTAGLALGILAALNHNGWKDRSAMVIAVIGVSVPGFVIGTLLQYFISVKLDLLPVAGWDTWQHRILPPFALGLGTLALMARMMRASMLDVINQDYIKTAKAKGLTPNEIVWRHTIRNAILPIITILGPLVVNIITGTLVVEQIFGIPGLGKYYTQSINNRDYTLIMGTTVFYAVLLLVAMFVVDIAYGFVDPRIRLSQGKE